MKNKGTTSLFLMATFLLIGSYVFASFPVRTNAAAKTLDQTTLQLIPAVKAVDTTDKSVHVASPTKGDDDLLITALLWFFLGFFFAAHRWYKHKPVGWNILYMFLCLLFGIGIIWWIIDGVNIFTGNF